MYEHQIFIKNLQQNRKLYLNYSIINNNKNRMK